MSLYLVGMPASVLGETALKILSFAYLPTGWDYGCGGPIEEEVRNLGLAWNSFFHSVGYLETDAFPGGDGELVVASGYGDHYFEIIVETDATISLAYDFAGKQVFYRPNISFYEAQQTITKMAAGSQWTSSGYFTQINLIRGAVNSPDQHSATHARTAASQLSMSNVLTNLVPPSAPTSVNITNNTRASFGNPQYFGDSHPVYFQRVTP
jgi:hypothetical protein